MSTVDDSRASKRRRHNNSDDSVSPRPSFRTRSTKEDYTLERKQSRDEESRRRRRRSQSRDEERGTYRRRESPRSDAELRSGGHTSSSRRSRSRSEDKERHRSREQRHEQDTGRHSRKRRDRSRSTSRHRSDKLSRADDRHHTHRHKHRHRDRNQDSDEHRSRSHQHRSESPKQRIPHQRSKAPLPSQNSAFNGTTSTTTDNSSEQQPQQPPISKQKPNFNLTGKLAAASNTIQTSTNQSIILKYHEPPESRKPPPREAWRMYIFKDEEILDTIELSEQSCWLFGREVAVVDFPLEHTSASKQHAVVQFRFVETRNEFGDRIGKVKPYVIDLESANGTKLNEDLIPAGRYLELRDKDILKFGHSSREYVVQLPSR